MTYKLIEIGKAGVDVIDGDRGKNYPHQNELFDCGDCVFLSANNVTSSGFRFDSVVFITAEKDSILRSGKLKRNDIVITTRGTVGNVAIYDDTINYSDVRINSGMLIIRCSNSIDSKFLYHVLKSNSFQRQIKQIQTGTAQPQLPKSHFLKMLICLPPLEVQKKISSFLNCLEQKIKCNENINQNLLQQAQLVFANEFLSFDSLPEGWEESSLLGIADYLNGLAMQKFRPKDGEIGLPVLKIKELRQGSCDSSSELCSPSIKSDYIIHDGDVVFSWSGSLLVDLWCGGTCGLNQHLFKVTSDKYDKWFYFSWTNHHLQKFIAIAADMATTMGHIKREELEKAKVIIPPHSEYERIGSLLAPIYDLVISNRIENRRLASIRDSLLPKLMSGELDVSDLEI